MKYKMKLITSTIKGIQQSKINDLSLAECEKSNVANEDSVLSYDHKQFLKIALEGNDFSDSTISANTNNDFNIHHNSTLTKQHPVTSSTSSTNNSHIAGLPEGASSIETMDASKLISLSESRAAKGIGLFRTLYEKTRESFRFKKDTDNQISETLSKYPSSFSRDHSYNESLLEEILSEIHKKKQLLQARRQCLFKKKFQDTAQQIEVERQLLYTDSKIKTLQSFITKIDYEQSSIRIPQSNGDILITDIIIPVKDTIAKDFSEYYVCILSYDQYVFMTDYIKVMDNKFVFTNTNIHFNNIDTNFEIKVEFYSLRLKKSIRNYSHESRYNLKTDSTCPTPQLLLSPARSILKSKNWSVTKFRTSCEKSQFSYQGSLILNMKNISLFGSYILTDLPSTSNAEGVVDISLNARVRLLQECSGFLTIGSEIGGCAFWNRKWCRLDGFIFNYWNYPEDEGLKVPCGTIDLRFCNTSEIKQASRQICSRNFTLLIEIKQLCKPLHRASLSCSTTHIIERNLLAADSRAELINWKNIFNDVLCTLKQWNSLISTSFQGSNECII